MAQMRVKDQDLIVEQVINKIESNELELLKSRKDFKLVFKNANRLIENIKLLQEEYKSINRDIKAEKENLESLVDSFQKANGFVNDYSTNQGIKLNTGYHSDSDITCDAVWNLDWDKRSAISTKLRLQTISGDFDVYQLIEDLVNEFSN